MTKTAEIKGKIDPNVEHKLGDLVVYGLIPTDLSSLREPNGPGTSQGGKVGAHGVHAGHQILKYANHPDVKRYIEDGIANGADYFNTCITLDGTSKQIETVIAIAKELGYVCDVVKDPGYPWFVSVEDARCLNDRCKVVWEVRSGDKVLVQREQITFAWILGDKTNDLVFRGLVANLNWAK